MIPEARNCVSAHVDSCKIVLVDAIPMMNAQARPITSLASKVLAAEAGVA